MQTKDVKEIEILLENKKLFDNYYKNYSEDFWLEKDGILFSQITNNHLEKLEKLNLTLDSKIILMNSIIKKEKRNFIYITYQDSNENSIPIGECIEKINEKTIRNIEEIKEISKIESIQLMNGEIYYLI